MNNLFSPPQHKLRELGYPSYTAYLKSQHWQTIRKLYRIADVPQKCPCGKNGWQLHHQDYDLLGREWKNLACLMPMCGGCHKFLHGLAPRPADFCLTPRGRLHKK